ncbi:hypothetical protein H8356DRAFT_1326184 [Neocallimastix lanati (nom. inval.)]|nr:hypothetical protein H8356DRAFT_1326184 [Neocallimastix sp. JGI-2020a]
MLHLKIFLIIYEYLNITKLSSLFFVKYSDLSGISLKVLHHELTILCAMVITFIIKYNNLEPTSSITMMWDKLKPENLQFQFSGFKGLSNRLIITTINNNNYSDIFTKDYYSGAIIPYYKISYIYFTNVNTHCYTTTNNVTNENINKILNNMYITSLCRLNLNEHQKRYNRKIQLAQIFTGHKEDNHRHYWFSKLQHCVSTSTTEAEYLQLNENQSSNPKSTHIEIRITLQKDSRNVLNST